MVPSPRRLPHTISRADRFRSHVSPAAGFSRAECNLAASAGGSSRPDRRSHGGRGVTRPENTGALPAARFAPVTPVSPDLRYPLGRREVVSRNRGQIMFPERRGKFIDGVAGQHTTG